VRNLADRYADALVDVALSQNAAPEVRRQLGDFLELLREAPDLRLLLDSPAVSRPSKRAVVESLAVRMGASKTMRNFLMVVLDRRRTALLPEIQAAFDTQLDERMGVSRAAVTSAHALSDVEKAELIAALAHITGKRVDAEYRIDPALIAGAVVRIGSTIYNGSVQAQLERLRAQLATP
jgi:F-type H+-transporting ATPase subunit delta